MFRITKEKELKPVITTSSISVLNNTNKSWGQRCSAMSADGTIVYIGAQNDYIYKSVDGGLSFQPITSIGPAIWNEIATSADGNYVALTTQDISNSSIIQIGTLFVSNNGGASWAVKITAKRWSSVGVSNNGQKMIACAQANQVGGDYVYISTDYGITWAQNNSLGSGSWTAAKISGDGSLYVACAGLSVRTSSDTINWTSYVVPFGTGIVTSLALSLNGQYQILSIASGPFTTIIYVSTDFGATWLSRRTGSNNPSVAISSNGQYMTYTLSNNTNGVSSNFGSTFTTLTSLGTLNWVIISMSEDGTSQLIGIPNTGLYKSTDNGTTFSALPTLTTNSVTNISYITTEFNRNSTVSTKIKIN